MMEFRSGIMNYYHHSNRHAPGAFNCLSKYQFYFLKIFSTFRDILRLLKTFYYFSFAQWTSEKKKPKYISSTERALIITHCRRPPRRTKKDLTFRSSYKTASCFWYKALTFIKNKKVISVVVFFSFLHFFPFLGGC
jgi:hypothetical protein